MGHHNHHHQHQQRNGGDLSDHHHSGADLMDNWGGTSNECNNHNGLKQQLQQHFGPGGLIPGDLSAEHSRSPPLRARDVFSGGGGGGGGRRDRRRSSSGVDDVECDFTSKLISKKVKRSAENSNCEVEM